MSKNNQARAITGDEDTDSILAEMEAGGEQLPVFADAPSEDDETEEAGDEESTEETEDEEEKSEDADTEDDESEEEAEDEESEEDSEDEEAGAADDTEEESDEEDTQDRAPLWKRHKELKKQLKEANSLVESLKKTTTDADLDSKLEIFSKKFNLSKEAAKEMVSMAASLAASQSGIDPALKQSLESVAKRDAEQRHWDNQERSFRKDFTQNVAPILARDGKKTETIQKALQEAAFKPENVKKSLVTLYFELFAKTEGHRPRITTEGNRTHGRIPSKKTEDLQAEDIDAMSDEEFDEYSESQGKQSKSRIVRH